jgi:DNA modification methylase
MIDRVRACELAEKYVNAETRILMYDAFIAAKIPIAAGAGNAVSASTHKGFSQLYGFQSDIVEWALRRGRAAVFADCGLGKTPIQLIWADIVAQHTSDPVLIFAPIAVAHQTVLEGVKFHVPVNIAESTFDLVPGVNITNYEKMHRFTDAPGVLGGVVLDESSILKSFDGKFRQQIIDFCENIPYRLACTATPAPNDLVELCNHADFLGLMRPKEVKALFFKQDGTAQEWRLKHHAAEDFWGWLASWSVSIRKPSDLKYEDGGFRLPQLSIHEILTPDLGIDISGVQGRLKSRRAGIEDRVMACADLINADRTKDPWVVWCNLNDESKLLTDVIDGAVELTGSDRPSHKERVLSDFATGKIRVLVTKPRIAGFGMNWQHCNKMAFVGLSDSYEQYYQAVRRCWRFGQTREVHAYVIAAESEKGIVENIKRKEKQSATLMDQLIKRTSVYSIENCRRTDMNYQEDVAAGTNWEMYLGDCIRMLDDVCAPDSVGLSVFSPPFPSMYVYTNSPADVGNVKDIEELIEHFRFLAVPLLKVTMPGRSCCVHLTQAVAFKGVDGYIGKKDFRGKTIQMFEDCGWIYYGESIIDKNPQIKAIRTHDSGLLFKSLSTDSAQMHMAPADFIIQFMKPGDNPEPIHAGISEKYKQNGNGWITPEEWIEWAAPVWYRYMSEYIVDRDMKKGLERLAPKFKKLDIKMYDEIVKLVTSKPNLVTGGIRETDTLQVRKARTEQDERHLCPLQLSVIERCVKLWSNPGNIVLDPFAGIGSTGHIALKAKRKFVGFELKESYFKVACENLAKFNK